MTSNVPDSTLCATCDRLALIIEKPPDMIAHFPGAWPIALCSHGHTSWRLADGTWASSIEVT